MEEKCYFDIDIELIFICTLLWPGKYTMYYTRTLERSLLYRKYEVEQNLSSIANLKTIAMIQIRYTDLG